MTLYDDERSAIPVRKPAHELGQDLSRISVDELTERIAWLREEILRLEREIASKTAQRDAASGLFKR